MQLSPKQKETFDFLKSKGHSTLNAVLQAIEPPGFLYSLQLNPDRKGVEADYYEFGGRGFFVIFDHESFVLRILDDKTFDNTEETEESRDLMKMLAKLRVNFRLKKKA